MEEQLEPQLEMKLNNLTDLPEVVLPDGFNLRHFKPGDEQAWEEIINESFDTNDKPTCFEVRMQQDAEYRPERVLFICDGDKPIATASAWHVPKYGPQTGTIHMVGALKEYAGKRLGYLVSLAALHQMAKEGRTSAHLLTDDFRIPAIKTYLRLQFEPHIVAENQPARWDKILATLKS